MGPADYNFIGATVDLSGILGLPIVGDYNPIAGAPEPHSFTAEELAAIAERTVLPLDRSRGWQLTRGSSGHQRYEYYAHDISIPPTGNFDSNEVGEIVYNPAVGADVITDVVFAHDFASSSVA